MSDEQFSFYSLPAEPTREMLEAGEMAMSAIPADPKADLQDIWRAMRDHLPGSLSLPDRASTEMIEAALDQIANGRKPTSDEMQEAWQAMLDVLKGGMGVGA